MIIFKDVCVRSWEDIWTRNTVLGHPEPKLYGLMLLSTENITNTFLQGFPF